MYNIRHKKEESADFDYYSTDPDSVRALLAVEKFNANILEPACCGGAISETLKQTHYYVKSSDLVPRGCGEVKDFFKIDNWGVCGCLCLVYLAQRLKNRANITLAKLKR